MYDYAEHKKRKRAPDVNGDLALPGWAAHMSEPNRRNIQLMARMCLDAAIMERKLVKGKAANANEDFPTWRCFMKECAASTFGSHIAFLDHLRKSHGKEERALAQIRFCIKQEIEFQDIMERHEKGITAAGRQWPGPPCFMPGSSQVP
jgi:hypothetical protein